MTTPSNHHERVHSVAAADDTRPRVVTWNVVTLDGRVAVSGSTPAWLDERWTPVKEEFDYVDIGAVHDATVTLTGSNNFVARDAGPADLTASTSFGGEAGDFLPADVMSRASKWMAVIDSRGRVEWTRTEGDGRRGIVLVLRHANRLSCVPARQTDPVPDRRNSPRRAPSRPATPA